MYNSTEISDYYEVLCVDRNTEQDVIDKIYRHLIKKYHPDYNNNPNIAHFKSIVEAYATLRDPVKRREYDKLHPNKDSGHTQVYRANDLSDGVEVDVELQNNLLLTLYERRKSSVANPGIGGMHLLSLIGCSEKSLEFVIWYLKEKGFINREENGTFSISLNGVDHIIQRHARKAELLQISHASDVGSY